MPGAPSSFLFLSPKGHERSLMPLKKEQTLRPLGGLGMLGHLVTMFSGLEDLPLPVFERFLSVEGISWVDW